MNMDGPDYRLDLLRSPSIIKFLEWVLTLYLRFLTRFLGFSPVFAADVVTFYAAVFRVVFSLRCCFVIQSPLVATPMGSRVMAAESSGEYPSVSCVIVLLVAPLAGSAGPLRAPAVRAVCRAQVCDLAARRAEAWPCLSKRTYSARLASR